MRSFGRFLGCLGLLVMTIQVAAQDSIQRCATVERLEQKLSNASLRQNFLQGRELFNQRLKSPAGNNLILENTINTIPVVFHIVLPNPSVVSNAQILAQLDTLNKDYGGLNGDSSKIPSWFKGLFGKSSIRFCLAQRSPDNQPTTGIHRVTSRVPSFSVGSEDVKHDFGGGTDSWDHNQYMNIWITALSGGILGYSSFPDDGSPNEQGVVIDYRALPGGSFSSYDEGKTLTHETGHFFNLYHIWGDDNGDCSGTDFIDDTPDQGNSTSSCRNGIDLDFCTRSGNGIMYQNYMDYTPDACLLMFTPEQVARMEASLSNYYPGLLSSTVCQPLSTARNNVALVQATSPEQRLCQNNFIPAVVIKNLGNESLTRLRISTLINNDSAQVYEWTGSLDYLASTTISLRQVLLPGEGKYNLRFISSQPNDAPDEEPGNDSLSISTQYYVSVEQLSESFESTPLPAGWDIVKKTSLSWQRINGTAADGNASYLAPNFGTAAGRTDLRLRTIHVDNVDSAYLGFKIAATRNGSSAARADEGDTLQVMLSTDCGLNNTVLFSKSGNSLSTTGYTSDNEYSPSASEWKADSINLTDYVGKGDLLISFRNGGAGQNNVFLDDIELRTITVNPNLKARGILISPNPARNSVAIQFYPPPADLRSISLFTMSGQKLKEISVGNTGLGLYNMDLSGNPAGVYLVVLRYANRIVQRKIVKVK